MFLKLLLLLSVLFSRSIWVLLYAVTPAGCFFLAEVVLTMPQCRSLGTVCCYELTLGVFGRFDLAALCGCHTLNVCCCCCFDPLVLFLLLSERERELRKEGREVPSRVRLREGPIGVRITLGQPTIG